MVRRLNIKKTKKKVRATKSEAYFINTKYLGDEPSFSGEITRVELITSLNWYSSMSTIKEAREYFEKYLIDSGRKNKISKLNKLHDNWIPTTACWLMRLTDRGVLLSDDHIEYIESNVSKCFSRVDKEAKEKKENKTENTTVRDKFNEKLSDLLAEIEELVDNRNNLKDFSFYDWLKAKEVQPLYTNYIIKRYQGWLDELLDVYAGNDKELKEAYSNFKKSEIENDILFFNSIIEDCEKFKTVVKTTRAPRKQKPISVEKKIKGLKYQKEDSNFKIASISPEKVIGAQELWTFNTKYKTLTVLRAIDNIGLQVKGTSIINYDENNSFTKRTGRKAEYFVQRVLNGGKLVLRKLMDEQSMGTNVNLAYRINENTILLKVY